MFTVFTKICCLCFFFFFVNQLTETNSRKIEEKKNISNFLFVCCSKLRKSLKLLTLYLISFSIVNWNGQKFCNEIPFNLFNNWDAHEICCSHHERHSRTDYTRRRDMTGGLGYVPSKFCRLSIPFVGSMTLLRYSLNTHFDLDGNGMRAQLNPVHLRESSDLKKIAANRAALVEENENNGRTRAARFKSIVEYMDI